MKKFQSIKVIDGFSACFRQWRAQDTHCQFIHGYAISVVLTFEGELDYRSWTYDFGGFKRATHTIDGMSPKQWFEYLLDHTMLVAEDDPYLHHFENMHKDGIVQLRVLPHVGCERFAEYIYEKVQAFLTVETKGRVGLVSVQVRENEKNSAIFSMK